MSSLASDNADSVSYTHLDVYKRQEQQKLESAKARALQEAGDIMERLNDVIPKLDAGDVYKRQA